MDNVAHDGRSSTAHSQGYAIARAASERRLLREADRQQQLQEEEGATGLAHSMNLIPFLPRRGSAPSLGMDEIHQQQRHGNHRSSLPSYPSSPATSRRRDMRERTPLLRTTPSSSPLPSPSAKTGTSKYHSDRYVPRGKSLKPPRLDTNTNAPKTFSRRKAPISHAVRYIMEVLCTDLVACGECYVLDTNAGQTLIRDDGFVPIEVDEAVDDDLTRFMQGDPLDLAYGRGVGLPGMAWASSRVTMVELLSLKNDPYFDAGGKRLRHAARLFKSALTVPLFSTDGVHLLGGRQLMGVVLVYFPIEWNEEKPLLTFASTVAASASAISELMVRRAVFVDNRAKRVKRNWRVMKIALRFIIPMIMRYKALTGKNVLEDVDVDHLEAARARTTVITTPYSPIPTAFRTPRYKLAIDVRERSPWAVSPGVSAVLNSQEGAKRISLNEANTVDDLWTWLGQYATKAKGGPVHMPEPNNVRDSFVTWAGVFCSISLLELTVAVLNDNVHFHNQENLFFMSGFFGALSTLLFAMPSAKPCQPRIILAGHSLAVFLSIMTICMSTPGKMVWLQQSATVASTTLGMCLFGVIHPPAGALVLLYLGAFNQGASLEKICMMIVSVYIGLVIHVVMGIFVNNFSPRRGYPVFW